MPSVDVGLASTISTRHGLGSAKRGIAPDFSAIITNEEGNPFKDDVVTAVEHTDNDEKKRSAHT